MMPAWCWLSLAGFVCGLPARGPALVRLRQGLALSRPARPGTSAASVEAAIGSRLAAMAARLPWRRLHIALALTVGLLCASAGVRPLAAVAAAVIAGMLTTALAATATTRIEGRRRRQVRLALAVLEAELTAGAGESEALRGAASVAGASGPALRAAAAAADQGGDVAAYLRGGGSDLAALVAAWHVRATCGAALAAIVGQVERDLAASDSRGREVQAALAGPRASAGLLAALPVIGVLLGSAMGAHPMGFLLADPTGSVVLLVGVLLDAAGLAWIRRMVRADASP